MEIAEDSLEWRSIQSALRTIPAGKPREILGQQPRIIAYTDGACIKNPGGPAGWSIILHPASAVVKNTAIDDTRRIECYGHIPKSPTTTNNRAEISAVLAVLCVAPRDVPLEIHSDSEYTIKVAQGTYKMKANPDLWALYRLFCNRRTAPLTFEWVRGHAGHDLNERADELAGLGAWNGDEAAYKKWQASSIPEAHNSVQPAEVVALRQQVERLKALFDTIAIDSGRVSPKEREFINDMAKRLQKNRFVPSPSQSNWLKGLVAKYKV